MLPTYASPPPNEKMNRHGYGGSGGANGYPMGGAYPGGIAESRGRTFNIRPDKYEKCVFYHTAKLQ